MQPGSQVLHNIFVVCTEFCSFSSTTTPENALVYNQVIVAVPKGLLIKFMTCCILQGTGVVCRGEQAEPFTRYDSSARI